MQFSLNFRQLKVFLMFMSNKDLPLYGKALAWFFVFLCFGIGVALIVLIFIFCNFIVVKGYLILLQFLLAMQYRQTHLKRKNWD